MVCISTSYKIRIVNKLHSSGLFIEIRLTATWGFQHNTSAKQAITGISYGAAAAIGANSVCADGVLMTMVIVSSTFIKI